MQCMIAFIDEPLLAMQWYLCIANAFAQGLAFLLQKDMPVVMIHNVQCPENHLLLAILATLFCFWPTGIIAIIFSLKVDTIYTLHYNYTCLFHLHVKKFSCKNFRILFCKMNSRTVYFNVCLIYFERSVLNSKKCTIIIVFFL